MLNQNGKRWWTQRMVDRTKAVKKTKKPKVWPPPEYALPSLKELERLSQPTLFVK